MKKIVLVTIQDNNNLGNRLQNYALQSVLENNDCKITNLTIKQVYNHSFLLTSKTCIKKILAFLGIKRFVTANAIQYRRSSCVYFTQKYIHDIIAVDRNTIRGKDWSLFDYALTGSDQVWHNWHRIEDELSFFYLDFIPQEKRISYAPSFGFTEFPEKDLERHRRGLMEMAALSCREQEGCDLIYQLTGRKAEKVLDPTLLLSAEVWKQIEKKPDFRVKDGYLLQFMLGEVSSDYKSEIERIAKEKNIHIIDLNNKNDPRRYGVSPDQFVWLLHQADVVCTDSFHASVFSILFEKDLRVYERISPQHGNMFGRLRDLLEPLDLIENVYGRGQKLNTVLTEENKAYLSREREKSVQYLRKSLGIEDA